MVRISTEQRKEAPTGGVTSAPAPSPKGGTSKVPDIMALASVPSYFNDLPSHHAPAMPPHSDRVPVHLMYDQQLRAIVETRAVTSPVFPPQQIITGKQDTPYTVYITGKQDTPYTSHSSGYRPQMITEQRKLDYASSPTGTHPRGSPSTTSAQTAVYTSAHTQGPPQNGNFISNRVFNEIQPRAAPTAVPNGNITKKFRRTLPDDGKEAAVSEPLNILHEIPKKKKRGRYMPQSTDTTTKTTPTPTKMNRTTSDTTTMTKLEKNRQSAKDCRARKKRYIQSLEADNIKLKNEVDRLRQECRLLMARVEALSPIEPKW